MIARAIYVVLLGVMPFCAVAQPSHNKPLATNFADTVWAEVVNHCPTEALARDDFRDLIYYVLAQPLSETTTDGDWTLEVMKLELAAPLLEKTEKQAFGLVVIGAASMAELLKFSNAVGRADSTALNEDRQDRARVALELWECMLPLQFEEVNNQELNLAKNPRPLLLPAIATNLVGRLCEFEGFTLFRSYIDLDVSIIRPDHGNELFGLIMVDHQNWLEAGNGTPRCEEAD
ncbi:hypothetical protein [Yoonia sp. SS1-5]|uniref:Uncharacterized protein n=1 Tax=Yoonia rhodophyticola TaxID=3137370 RepID=A0AAN0M7A9_9RHOB